MNMEASSLYGILQFKLLVSQIFLVNIKVFYKLLKKLVTTGRVQKTIYTHKPTLYFFQRTK